MFRCYRLADSHINTNSPCYHDLQAAEHGAAPARDHTAPPPPVAPHPSLLSPHSFQPQVPLEGQGSGGGSERDPDVANAMALPVYDKEYLLAVKPYHIPPTTVRRG